MFQVDRFLVWCTGLAILLGAVLATEERYLLHSAILDADGRFQVQWGPGDEDDLVFKVTVRTLGYVSLGLSPNGGMAGSDVATGYVKDGTAFLQDRFAEGKFMPRKDKSQDWLLLSGHENDTHTTLLFRRKLETCDEDDITIDTSTMRVIYAFSDKDPKDEDSIPYHSMNRGKKSIMLLQPEVKRKPELEGTSYWDVLSPNHTIRGSDASIYWCKINKAPELSEKHHVVMIEPLIEKGHESYVHHLVLYECLNEDNQIFEELVESEGHQCYHPNMPDAMTKCEGVYAAWGVGGESLVFPDHVGMPLDPSPAKYYMLEVHYDNPEGHDGIQDRSGFRLHYTTKLRRYDAGSLMLGAAVNPRVIIPPGQPEYTVAGHASPDCLSPAIEKDGLKIIGVFQHSHLLGRRMKTRHFRNGIELPPLAEDSNYDFNYQEYHYFSEEVAFSPEDQITVECTYDSTGAQTTTFGGLSTKEEMCLSFVLYYPKIQRYASVSVAPKHVVTALVGGDELTSQVKGDGYKKFMDVLKNYDWSKTDVDLVQEGLRYTDHNTYCYMGTGVKTTIKTLISYPKDLQEYAVTPSCVEEGSGKLIQRGGSYSIHDIKKEYSILLFLLLLLL